MQQWIVILLAVIALLLGVLVWQFVGDDLGRWWNDVIWWWGGERRRGLLTRLLVIGGGVLFYVIAASIWRELFPPKP